ncbi:hypothetical protein TWF225_008634 [Orbilia oligospora]|nr:hypothetical protein TWF751_005878 [Orbilia oligospora]KAF3176567.1 hypothetical protein TWF225_008634 [Orbilia oligospora]KAF3252771.1 hypothetical protein TWF128_006667 [Orbilia oligospora]KAF3252875.1 hypothetical protein TWF217_007617 [Orbilia oligospora]KAF3293230.1 hypothetical protein TWF132_004878 [Orbilia oligospora]
MVKTPELCALEELLGRELLANITPEDMQKISTSLTVAYATGLKESVASMLPSHIYFLPSGQETGYYLAVDLGGSTLRVAIVHLEGYKDPSLRGSPIDPSNPRPMNIVQIKSWGGSHIDHLKTLTGNDFFDWIADRIGDVVEEKFGNRMTNELPLGLSWSFPIESTSIDRGKIQPMGKGFRVANKDLLGTDLKEHFQGAFERKGLHISMEAIVNDSLATLLSHAYVSPATRCGLILGTGTNAALSLPLKMLPESKLIPSHENRPSSAQEVLVNTELSMYGRDILPITKWDDALDKAMPLPGFQPLEYLIGGAYLGEIARLIILDVRNENLLNRIPECWEKKPYSLGTEILALLEDRAHDQLPTNYHELNNEYPDVAIPEHDALALKTIALHISARAANFCAISLHAIIKLREKAAKSPSSHPTKNIVPIAFVGTVLEKYPSLLRRTQDALDKLTDWQPTSPLQSQRIVLEFSAESAIYGAAVAVAAVLEKKVNPPVSPLSLAPPNPFNAPRPLSFPSNERSSNASTLVGQGSSMEEETKPNGKKVSGGEVNGLEVPPFNSARSTDGPDDQATPTGGAKKPLWSRIKAFFQGVFGKMLKKRSKQA